METKETLTLEDIRTWLCDNGYEETVLFENPDYASAVIGISEDGRLIYDYDLMVQFLVEAEGMEQEDAIDFIDFNTIGSLPYAGVKPPIVMYRLLM